MPARLPLILALTLMVLPAAAGPKSEKAEEKECPHAYGAFDKIGADIDKAPSCKAASEIASSCALGGTSDQRLGGFVVERCERDFLSGLTKGQKRAYAAEQNRCERRFARQQGSIYRSEEAFCLVGIAEKYVKRFARTGAAKK